jgi:hypothetical protein
MIECGPAPARIGGFLGVWMLRMILGGHPIAPEVFRLNGALPLQIRGGDLSPIGTAYMSEGLMERIAHYREQATQYRQWAADETVAEARDGLLDMARQYDRLASELEAKTAPALGADEAHTALAADMKMVEEYRRRAAEVDQLAKEAISEDHQQRILGIARSWRELADQREAMLTKRYGVPRSSK